ncbi:MAG: hypothetical protein JEZ03_15485 [Bacteroidales bacterium]|nr:hypothetical protein [Bacteroidales bacterium]
MTEFHSPFCPLLLKLAKQTTCIEDFTSNNNYPIPDHYYDIDMEAAAIIRKAASELMVTKHS